MTETPTPLDLDAITPDERAAMRERYAADLPSAWDTSAAAHGRALRALGTSARDDVPRLLDALDAAEAEVARLRARHVCRDMEDYAEAWNAGYETAVTQGLADDPARAEDWLAEHDEPGGRRPPHPGRGVR